MKTAEEIKKGLECCSVEAMHCGPEDPKCSYECGSEKCIINLMQDALALIQQLEPIKALVEQYIAKYRITCSESIWQMDKPQLGAIELADKLCRLVGYMDVEDE